MTRGIIEAELSEHGFYASNTLGTSMRPLFKTHRDMIVVKRPEGELRKYDVALYVTPSGKYILHRVIAVRENIYLIRGDNTYSIERVPKEWVIGVLVKFNRRGKSHTTDERLYKIYSRFWNFIYPVRYVFWFAKRAARAVLRRIFKRKNRADVKTDSNS